MKTLIPILMLAVLCCGCVTQADTAAMLNATNAATIDMIARCNADSLNPNNARDLADANAAETQALAINAKAVSVNVAELGNIINLAENLVAWILHNTPWFPMAKPGTVLVAPTETAQQQRNDAVIEQFRIQHAANVAPK